MRLVFHDRPASLEQLCADLQHHGAVRWTSASPKPYEVVEAMNARGIGVMVLCAIVQKGLVPFAVRADLVGDFRAFEVEVAQAFEGETVSPMPVGQTKVFSLRGSSPSRARPVPAFPYWARW